MEINERWRVSVICKIIYQEFKFVIKFDKTGQEPVSPMNKSFDCIDFKKKTAKAKKAETLPKKCSFR